MVSATEVSLLLIGWFSPLGSDWVDPDDPTVIAEAELLGAANSIEAAAKKLSQLQARQLPKVEVTMMLSTVDSIEVLVK